jgi:hypothetical protein
VNIKTKTNSTKNVANFFGAFGYLSCFLQWIWTIMLYFSFVSTLVLFLRPVANTHVTRSSNVISPSLSMPMMILAIVITIFVVALTVYIIAKMPSTIAKTSKKVVHETAECITPLILNIQHKKDTEKNHIKLTPRLIMILKIILVTIPVVLALISQFIERQMIEFRIAIYVSLWLAGFSLLFFTFQYLIAKLLSVKKQNIW